MGLWKLLKVNYLFNFPLKGKFANSPQKMKKGVKSSQQVTCGTKLSHASNKHKNIENIIEMSVENFKNKIFLKREEKFEDFLDYDEKRKIKKKLIPKSDGKKSRASDFTNNGEIKSGSPVLWLKSQKRKENDTILKIFEMKEIEVPIDLLKNKNHSDQSTQPSPLRDSHSKKEKLNSSSQKNTLRQTEHTEIEDLPIIPDNLAGALPFNLTISYESIHLNSPDVHGGILKWKYGDKIAEGSSSLVYKAFNLMNGSIFVVKRFHSINDEKLALSFQVNKFKLKQN